MNKKLAIDEVRHFIAAASKQLEQGGIFIERIRFHRLENGDEKEIYIDYEEREATDKSKGGQVNG